MNADFVVTIDGPNGRCDVTLGDGTRRQSMACLEVASHVASTLKLPRGALFDVVTVPDIDESEYDRVMSDLSALGYKLTPGWHIGFLTEPKGNDR